MKLRKARLAGIIDIGRVWDLIERLSQHLAPKTGMNSASLTLLSKNLQNLCLSVGTNPSKITTMATNSRIKPRSATQTNKVVVNS